MPVRIQLTIYNTGSHFSEDKFNLMILHFVFLLVFLGLTVYNHRRFMEDQKRFEEEDSPLYFTWGSLNMMVLHFILKTMHNFFYSFDGVGSIVSEMIAHILQIFSRITIITILIAFAFGWQVIYENTVEVRKKIQWVYIFVLCLTAYDDYALSKWVQEHPGDLFHLMQSNIQWTFYFTKFLEYCIFLFAIWRSKRVNNKKLNEELTKISESEGTDVRELEV